ncbi:2-dehydropantoate 2-reductase [Parahaliea aestuarii]|uniref:2-dehydropantoate 2-reductase n=1 Tax=Parahaliea aestuarii TaxID=1852021 RepID=A0A5C9A4M9_9GAMM|nr:2-dehydropantoate 2-reductase [Parahaliea aestuarii]TXS94974.1 2-dehydropantoate 2-reductase [Parahaliea aestuarii]
MSASHWHILGCGAMGRLYAAQLSRAGLKVVLLPRTAPSGAAMAIDITGLSASHHALPWESPDASGPIQQLLVFTKAYDVAPALATVRHRLHDDSRVILMANGMGYAEELRTVAPALRPALGTSTQGAHRQGDGVVLHAGHGITRVGMPGVPHAPDWFAPLADALPDCRWESDINAALWRKLAINCAINPLTALHNCANGELGERPELATQVGELCREIAAVARAAGQAAALEGLETQVFEVIRATAANRSSMLQDFSAGRRSEIDYITGFVLRQALQFGISAPRNEALWRAVKARETAA